MPTLPGAEPYHHIGGPTGALLCHGFSGTPQSMRPWARHLAGEGFTVSVPRLPGHGTSWHEMARTRWEHWYAETDRALAELRGRCDRVFVLGLSLGGCLALRLAQQHGAGVAGLVLVNPWLSDRRPLRVVPAVRPLVRSVPGVGADIKREGVSELSYDRIPLAALTGLPRLWSVTRARLGEVVQPVLLLRSAQDHVIGPSSVASLRKGLPPANLTEEVCPHSYHVATLDNDAPMIFDRSVEFLRAHSPTLPERD